VEFVFIYVTAPSAEQAKSIGRTLVEERLAACVNILEGMTSFFWWEGKIDEAREAVLIAKTRAPLCDAVVDRVRQLHEYSCPCVVALPLVGGNPAFLEWIARETGSPSKPGGAVPG
jgi:periplasmic divalent cation tolerance protein